MEIISASAIVRKEFFSLLWGRREGYVMIASQTEAGRIAHDARLWREKPFLWPDEANKMLQYIDAEEHGRHVWFTPLLYDNPHRGEDDVTVADIVWADLEEVHPDSVTPSAPFVIESSPGRYQAIWKLDLNGSESETIPAPLASDYSRRLVEQYKHLGADTSGADLAQLLRVPGTYNYKGEYTDPNGHPPDVKILTANGSVRVPVQIFAALPPVQGVEAQYEDMPEALDVDDVIQKYRVKLPDSWFKLYSTTPDQTQDWSKLLWRFLHQSFEVDMDKQEVFTVAIEAKCNKFKRNGYKPNLSLWWDVLRAHAKFRQLRDSLVRYDRDAIDIPLLYDPDEVSGRESFVDRYYTWATSLGDATPQYHELSGFIILSAILAGNVRIESSIGDIVPNIWGMILADTTTTRKTTAMDRATDLIESVPGCEDTTIATDGSMEGIFKAMAQRPGKPSIFKKDEIQGFMASVGRKDYLAGMLEGLSKMYDGKTMKRQLSKDAITVHRPVFILFGAGIKTKMLSLLAPEHVESGFLPRFLFVTGDADVDKIKPIGPRTEEAKKVEAELRDELIMLRSVYVEPSLYALSGTAHKMEMPTVVAHPTQACWDRYAQVEKVLMKAGHESVDPSLYTPMLARFLMSTLKCATLLAAHRQTPKDDTITVEVSDFVDALAHTTNWIPYVLEILSNLGRTAFEADVQKVYKWITEHEGSPSGAVLRNYKLSARDARNIFETLEGRGMIELRKQGRGHTLWVVGE